MLVVLRVAIGWHFFIEGTRHFADPAWSSEGFLRQAKGPLRGAFKSVIPDYHGWNQHIYDPALDETHAVDAWGAAVGDAFAA